MTSSRGVSMSRMWSIAAPIRRGNLCRLSTSNRGADPDPFCRYLILHWLSQLGMFADSLRARSHYIFLNSSHFTFYVFRLQHVPWRKYKVCLQEDQVYAMNADDHKKLNKDKKKVERLAAAFMTTMTLSSPLPWSSRSPGSMDLDLDSTRWGFDEI